MAALLPPCYQFNHINTVFVIFLLLLFPLGVVRPPRNEGGSRSAPSTQGPKGGIPYLLGGFNSGIVRGLRYTHFFRSQPE
jgi:hypothetical protein